jgi:hypothetical protein
MLFPLHVEITVGVDLVDGRIQYTGLEVADHPGSGRNKTDTLKPAPTNSRFIVDNPS